MTQDFLPSGGRLKQVDRHRHLYLRDPLEPHPQPLQLDPLTIRGKATRLTAHSHLNIGIFPTYHRRPRCYHGPNSPPIPLGEYEIPSAEQLVKEVNKHASLKVYAISIACTRKLNKSQKSTVDREEVEWGVERLWPSLCLRLLVRLKGVYIVLFRDLIIYLINRVLESFWDGMRFLCARSCYHTDLYGKWT